MVNLGIWSYIEVFVWRYSKESVSVNKKLTAQICFGSDFCCWKMRIFEKNQVLSFKHFMLSGKYALTFLMINSPSGSADNAMIETVDIFGVHVIYAHPKWHCNNTSHDLQSTVKNAWSMIFRTVLMLYGIIIKLITHVYELYCIHLNILYSFICNPC